MVNSKVYSIDEIKEMLINNDNAVIRGILALYEKQTLDEQTAKNSRHSNGIGFNRFDSRTMSLYANQIKTGYELDAVQFRDARERIMKYSKQLMRIANKEI